MTVVFFIIYITIGLFDQTMNVNLEGYGNVGENIMFATLLQPWNYGLGAVNIGGVQVPTLLGMLGLAITTAVGIALITSVIGRSDIVTMFALFSALLMLGAPTILIVYSFITRNVEWMYCIVGEPCMPANLAGGLFAGILSIMWLMTCLEWWAWRATTQ